MFSFRLLVACSFRPLASMLLSTLAIFSEIAGPVTLFSVTSVTRESTLLLGMVVDSPVLGELECVPKSDLGRLLGGSSTSCSPLSLVLSTWASSSSSSSYKSEAL